MLEKNDAKVNTHKLLTLIDLRTWRERPKTKTCHEFRSRQLALNLYFLYKMAKNHRTDD